MRAFIVIVAHVLRDDASELRNRFNGNLLGPLCFELLEKGFYEGVVVHVFNAVHALRDAVVLQPLFVA